MEPRENHPSGHNTLEPRSLPWDKIWSAFTSEVGDIFTEGATATPQPSGASSNMIEITTGVPVAVSTITVDTTVLRTSFVTIHVTTDIPRPRPTSCSDSAKCDSSSNSLPPVVTGGKHTSLPPVVTDSPSSSPPSHTQGDHQPVSAPSSTESATSSTGHASNKHAIIGGLSGAIAGLVIIGILICFFLRRHRPRDKEDESISEKGIRPVIAQKWSQITAKRATPVPVAPETRGSTPDFDGGLIRVSLENWPRPFAHGEGFRESMGPSRFLRVMNPDPSLPTTPLPRRSSESNTTGGFLKQQRSALAAVLLGANRTNSPARGGLQVPGAGHDPAYLSTENVAAPAPSFRSYSSVSSLPVVESRPPEDPFLTPPDERDEINAPQTPPTPRRPGLAPLQNAAGAAGRTLSHISSSLNPFRSKTNVAESVRTQSHYRHSSSTFSSAGDPFKLDRPSIHDGRTGSEYGRPPMPNWNVYEGT